jgi:hypothetical protein
MSKWVQKDAAALLHISPRVMNYKIKVLGIEIPRKGRAMVEPHAEPDSGSTDSTCFPASSVSSCGGETTHRDRR